MRKIVFILFAGLMIAAGKGKHKVPSGNRAYLYFSEFKSDTLRYAEINFAGKESFYIGKTVETLINDLEIPFEILTDRNEVVKEDSTGRRFRDWEMSGLTITFTPYSRPLYQPIMVKEMTIEFEQIVPYEIYTAAIKKANDSGIEWQYDDWKTVYSEVFGKSIIKDIKVMESEY